MALGGDQGCSVRAPAHYCGIVGLKPTHGLVSYTGVMSLELTIDHVGPMARTVYDTALLLEVSEYTIAYRADVNFYKLLRNETGVSERLNKGSPSCLFQGYGILVQDCQSYCFDPSYNMIA